MFTSNHSDQSSRMKTSRLLALLHWLIKLLHKENPKHSQKCSVGEFLPTQQNNIHRNISSSQNAIFYYFPYITSLTPKLLNVFKVSRNISIATKNVKKMSSYYIRKLRNL